MSRSERVAAPPGVCGAGAVEELDDFVRAFEEAYQHDGAADPAAFLPPSDHPLHQAVLRELVRVDLEFGWERGCPKPLDTYERDFPELVGDGEALCAIAFEEYRLRRQAGQAPSPDEYRSRYGMRLDSASGRPRPDSWGDDGEGGGGRGSSGSLGTADGTWLARGRWRAPESIAALPEVGDVFLGFRLIGDLGRGSFGRVYLARQGDLANRPVVLKVTADRHDEAHTLAQLQHDHIVPVYSRHRRGVLRAVCMPYLGVTTLRDVLAVVKGRGAPPASGRELMTSLARSTERRVANVRALSGQSQTARALPSVSSTEATHRPAVGPGGNDGGPVPAGSGGPSGLPDPAGAPPQHPAAPTPYARLSFVEAVVWIGIQIARGLAHAHERGILHRDLKPANVLLADDGRPMLLDFNLAADLKSRRDGAAGDDIGGTLPYMAPEHIEAFSGGGRSVDARSDVYALGVILYELLTGRPPFPTREAAHGNPEALRAMIADRHATPPWLRPFNPAVSPAMESIVRHCLEPDPRRRYASALELAEDLERQLAHRPLRHAPEPSPRERAGKWVRRQRKWLAALGLLGVLAVLAAALTARQDRLDQYEAREAAVRFRAEQRDAQARLAGWLTDPSHCVEGLPAARRALAPFHVLDAGSTPWWRRHPAARLDAPNRLRLRREVGELLVLIAQGERLKAGEPGTTAADRQAALRQALSTLERAEPCFDPGTEPLVARAERAALLEALGDPRADAARRRADEAGPETPADFLHAGMARARAGDPTAALRQFDRAIGLDPGYYWAWLSKGTCHAQLGDEAVAGLCFDVCIGLERDNPAAWRLRGGQHLRHNRLTDARADLDAALALRPDDLDATFNRALVDLRTGRFAETLAACDQLIERGAPYHRAYLVRAAAREALGDPVGARGDRAEGLRQTPSDGASWVARAQARALNHDLQGALDDLDQALTLHPRDFAALWNRAAYLSQTGRIAESIETLDRLVELNPSQSVVRSTRGVLHARLGHREAAQADVELAMTVSRDPFTVYQAASVRALNSRTNPEDREKALRFLKLALKDGFGLQLVDTDTDLDPIRRDPEFVRIVAAARARSGTPPSQDPIRPQGFPPTSPPPPDRPSPAQPRTL